MQHSDFVPEEKALLRTLCRDAALFAAKQGNRGMYRYGKRLLDKFQDNSLVIHLKLRDLRTLKDIVRSGISILEKSFNQKDVIDKDLLEMVTETEDQEEERRNKIDENIQLFELNRKQTETLLNLRDKVDKKIQEGEALRVCNILPKIVESVQKGKE